MSEKPKLAMYWAASCGGCEIALLNLHEKILDLDAAFDIMFCPCLLDTKKREIEALDDRSIAITLFNGAIRTAEHAEMAGLLRRKSRMLIAVGSCAAEGGIPGLANLCSRGEIMKTSYLENPTIDNPDGILPALCSEVPEGSLTLPLFYDRVKTLGEVSAVEYTIPGCPPESHQIWNVVELVLSGKPLPPAGSVIGAGAVPLCEECDRAKEEKRIARFYRSFEVVPEPGKCLLEQGVICMGIATRSGCGAPCPRANMPCTGCYGPPDGVADQGSAMIAALGSILDIGEVKGRSGAEIAARVEALLDSLPDCAGSFYKYGLPGSTIGGRVKG
ncbi:MAG: oxidoreductase [Geobacteraceae bacterium GWC2_58_44]|nr:MAG: oxidoreductase [Geobacteraceae bacterium GWC2_58_44]HBG07158.1 NADH:ubiquinone oxidoreductase [Geobacter sp.]